MATAIRLDDVPALRRPMTAEDLLRMPGETHGEIVNGVYVPMSAPGGWHGIVTARVALLVGAFVADRGLGATFGSETAFRLQRDPDTVRCPDYAFVGNERLPAVVRRGANEGAPDLAVEVLSPSNTPSEMGRKVAEYFRFGARAVWMFDPETRTAVAHTPFPRYYEGDDVLDGGEVLPGFAVAVSAFFAGLPAEAPAGADAPAAPDASAR